MNDIRIPTASYSLPSPPPATRASSHVLRCGLRSVLRTKNAGAKLDCRVRARTLATTASTRESGTAHAAYVRNSATEQAGKIGLGTARLTRETRLYRGPGFTVAPKGRKVTSAARAQE